jgi:hypothetical protein
VILSLLSSVFYFEFGKKRNERLLFHAISALTSSIRPGQTLTRAGPGPTTRAHDPAAAAVALHGSVDNITWAPIGTPAWAHAA